MDLRISSQTQELLPYFKLDTTALTAAILSQLDIYYLTIFFTLVIIPAVNIMAIKYLLPALI